MILVIYIRFMFFYFISVFDYYNHPMKLIIVMIIKNDHEFKYERKSVTVESYNNGFIEWSLIVSNLNW